MYTLGEEVLPSNCEVLEVPGNVSLGAINCFPAEWFQEITSATYSEV